MERIWKQREKEIDRVMKSTAGLYGDLRGIIGGQIAIIPALELEPGPAPMLPEPEVEPSAGEEEPKSPEPVEEPNADLRDLIREEINVYMTTPFDALSRLISEGPEEFESSRLDGGKEVKVRVTADWTRHGKAVRVTLNILGGHWPAEDRSAFFIMEESGRVVDQSRWLRAP